MKKLLLSTTILIGVTGYALADEVITRHDCELIRTEFGYYVRMDTSCDLNVGATGAGGGITLPKAPKRDESPSDDPEEPDDEEPDDEEPDDEEPDDEEPDDEGGDEEPDDEGGDEGDDEGDGDNGHGNGDGDGCQGRGCDDPSNPGKGKGKGRG